MGVLLFHAMRILMTILLLAGGAAAAEEVKFHLVSKDVVRKRLESGPLSNRDRGLKLQELFEEAGCRGDSLEARAVKGSKLPNLVCTLAGETGETIIVGAHFDHTPKGDGVVDNWSGASLLPSLFTSLKQTSRRFTWQLVGFADEELGLVGSRDFVKKLKRSTEVRAFINLDSLGLSPVKVWISRADKRLLAALDGVGDSLGLALDGVDVQNVGNSDSQPFRDRKIPVIDLHSITQQTLGILHSPKDTLAVIQFEDYYSSYRLIALYLSYLDRSF